MQMYVKFAHFLYKCEADTLLREAERKVITRHLRVLHVLVVVGAGASARGGRLLGVGIVLGRRGVIVYSSHVIEAIN